jgi:hypothetical protein
MTFPVGAANNFAVVVGGIAYVYGNTYNTFTRIPSSSSGGTGVQPYTILTQDWNITGETNILANTAAGSINISLPSVVTTGYSITIGDGGGNKDINPAYVLGGQNTINDVMDTLLFNSNGVAFTLVYTGTTWRTLINA